MIGSNQTTPKCDLKWMIRIRGSPNYNGLATTLTYICNNMRVVTLLFTYLQYLMIYYYLPGHSHYVDKLSKEGHLYEAPLFPSSMTDFWQKGSLPSLQKQMAQGGMQYNRAGESRWFLTLSCRSSRSHTLK